MSVVAALLIVAVVSLLALALGVALGFGVAPRIAERKQRRAADQDGITVSQMLQQIVALAPVGTGFPGTALLPLRRIALIVRL